MTASAYDVHERSGRSAGNGSLMRTGPVALAHLDPAHAEVGTDVEIDIRGRRYPFTIVSTPFYSREDA